MDKLREIAMINTGYPFRTRIDHDPDGRFAVIQMRDLENYTKLNYANFAYVSDIQPKPHHLINKEDILFISKGAHNFAAYVEKELNNTVATSNFLVIKVKSKNVLPAYLAWYINQKPAQVFLQENSTGTYIPAVSKTVLNELEISIPTLEVQRQIIRIQQLANKEKELISQIQSKRDQMIEALLIKKSKGVLKDGTV